MTRQNSNENLPPGPKGLPLIGSLLHFRKDPTGFLVRLARDYGDIASFRLGRHLCVQLNHPDLIRDVLVVNSRNFKKGRLLARSKRVMGNGLVTSEGDVHRRQRRLVQPAFNRERMTRYGDIVVECAQRTSRRWCEGKPVDIYTEMLDLTLSVVTRTLFGADLDSEQSARVEQALTVALEYFSWLMLPHAGFLERFPIQKRRRFERARETLDGVVYRMIEERRASGRDHGDLLSTLLLAEDTETDGSGMSDQQARDEVMTLFLAGHETTATALAWTWHVLAKNPEAYAEVQAEIERVCGRNVPPSPTDVSKLEYTRMVLCESMRIFPPVWMITRTPVEDYDVSGYSIPAGASVGMSQFVMHRDSRYFPEPERFDPLRWTESAVASRPKYCYFPFGGGPRLCIGEPFAWTEAILAVAALSQDWELFSASREATSFQPLLTLRPYPGLSMTPRRRRSRKSASEIAQDAATN